MTLGLPQPLEGGHVTGERAEDQLAKKASDKLQGAADKPGIEHLNEQVKQEQTNQKDERNQTLAEQIEKTGHANIGQITKQHGQSIEITDGDQILVKGRSKEEVAAALKEMHEASEKDMQLGPGGKFSALDSQISSVPEALTQVELQAAVKQFGAQNKQEKPLAVIAQNLEDQFHPQAPQVMTDATNATAKDQGWKLLDDSPLIAQVHRENPEESLSESLKRLHQNEKLVPKDGETLNLQQVLNDYKTPFMDAYEHSKYLKDGEPGKSKTLEELVDRLRDCPWADQIYVKFEDKAANTEYDPVHSTITIKPGDKPDAQIALFSHEGYHATHQFLNKMFSADKLDKQTFTNTLLWGEVGSMESEAKVHDELNLKTEKPQFFYRNADGMDDHIDINDFVKQNGIKGLYDFLEAAKPARVEQEPYGIYYQRYYKPYAEHFTQNRPAALKTIEKWVKSGRKAEDI